MGEAHGKEEENKNSPEGVELSRKGNNYQLYKRRKNLMPRSGLISTTVGEAHVKEAENKSSLKELNYEIY